MRLSCYHRADGGNFTGAIMSRLHVHGEMKRAEVISSYPSICRPKSPCEPRHRCQRRRSREHRVRQGEPQADVLVPMFSFFADKHLHRRRRRIATMPGTRLIQSTAATSRRPTDAETLGRRCATGRRIDQASRRGPISFHRAQRACRAPVLRGIPEG